MTDLFTAIYNKFIATTGGVHNSLYTALGGRLYNTIGSQPATYPYAVFLLVSGKPEWTFTDNMEDALIQFSLFDSNNSPVNISVAYGYLTSLYDDCALTISNYTHLYMWRENQQLFRDEENATWQYVIDYRILMDKT